MFQTKKYMVSVVTVLLLMVSMIFTACGGSGDVKKDAAQNDKPIEITDVTGQTVTLKKPAERVVVQWSASGGAFMRRVRRRPHWTWPSFLTYQEGCSTTYKPPSKR